MNSSAVFANWPSGRRSCVLDKSLESISSLFQISEQILRTAFRMTIVFMNATVG